MDDVCLPIYLNERWRVRADGLQWILEHRKSPKKTRKSSGWKARSFHTWRASLLREVGRLCGEVPEHMLASLADLPERFS